MKKLLPAIIAALAMLCVCLGFFLQNNHQGETVLSIDDQEDNYTFEASFYSGETPTVTQYINNYTEKLKKDHARFHTKISEGELIISVNKKENSPLAISNIKKMCQGINEILTLN